MGHSTVHVELVDRLLLPGLHYYEQPTISDDVNARTESIGMEWMIKLLQAAASAGKNVAFVIQSSINKNNELPDTYLLDAGDHNTLDQ